MASLSRISCALWWPFLDYGTSKGVVSHRRVFYAFRRVFKINRGVELPIDEPSPVSFSHDRVSPVNIL